MELNYFKGTMWSEGGVGDARLEQFKEWENRHEFNKWGNLAVKKKQREMGSSCKGIVEMKEDVLKSGRKLSIF